MKIFTHSFNPKSNSGPNKFTRQLFENMIKKFNVSVINKQEDADIEFCLIQQSFYKSKPMVLRLDGIYFNSDQDYANQNAPIKYSYDNADCVIFQSNFNKELIETWFGPHKNGHVIHNGADLEVVREANGNYWNSQLGQDTEVWTCASSWRPHKRLKENIRYFMEHAPKDSILCVAGDGIKSDDFSGWSVEQFRRIRYLGKLDYISLLSLYKRSTTFIHLSYLDHCPNVVVDAQASGCKIICSSTGGTSEIVSNGIVIKESNWDYSPIRLYVPPKLNFNNSYEIKTESKDTIDKVSEKYYNAMKGIL